MPWEFQIERLRQMFPGRLPSELMAEWQGLPVDTIERMAEYGAYAEAHGCLGLPFKERPKSELMDLAERIEDALTREAIEAEQHG